MTRIVGMLCWFDESPTWLAATIASVAPIVDHLVAVDGAYALFPDARASSGIDQHDAVVRTAEACGLGVTLHVPHEPWWGNEVEKRSRMFRLAQLVADDPERDWVFSIDADEVVLEYPADLRETLAAAESPAGAVELVERFDPHDERYEVLTTRAAIDLTSRVMVPQFFRSLPNMRVVANHWTYVADGEDGPVVLWGRTATVKPFRTGVVVEHRKRRRALVRAQAALDYYEARRVARAEHEVEPARVGP